MFGIDDAIAAGSKLIDSVVTRIWPDPTIKEKGKIEYLKQELSGEISKVIGQIEINKIEASSPSVFVSGWRPFLGWVCGASFAYTSLFEPMARFIASVIFGYTGPFPVINTSETFQILLGMLGLGLGGFRTYEKQKGVARK